MTTLKEISFTPVGVRGMKVLDREKFLRNLRLPFLRVKEKSISAVVINCKPYFLKLENFKPVRNNDDEIFKKCVYLNPEKITQWADFTEEIREILIKNGVSESDFDTKEVQLGYEHWSSETIFKAVLPENEEIVSGFSQIGHIIHLNLREHLLEYAQLIGQVFLDKVKTCRTVVYKTNMIDNTFRNFIMKTIAGEEDFLVTVKENRCIFQFDFSKVYWNPRLCKEHERILGFLTPGDVLFDVFCGVGPFSIPAAKRKSKVYANDLNPDAFKWLNHTADYNKVKKFFFKSYNLDGKDFICNVFKDYMIQYCMGNETLNGAKIYVTMNLPAIAVDFLKYFKGLIEDQELMKAFDCEITVYLYCFAYGEDPVGYAKKKVNKKMGCDMSAYIVDVFDVRNVAPMKEMMRVTLKLTKEVLFGVMDCENVSEPPQKKLCVEKDKCQSETE